jgi:hypothetical protein
MGMTADVVTESRLISRHLPRRDRSVDQGGGRSVKFSTTPGANSATFRLAHMLIICPLLQRRQTADCLQNAHRLMLFSSDCICGSITKLSFW